MSILRGFDDNGERCWSFDDPDIELRKAFFDDVKQRPAAKSFFRSYDVTPENMEVILHIAASLYPGVTVFNVSQFEDILASGIAAGEFHRKPAPPAPPGLETDKNGKTLTDAQKKWRDYRQFAETASADERRARCQADAGFRSFVENQRREEMAQPIDGATEQALVDRRTATDALREFAAKYLTMPAEEIRRLSRAATNPVSHRQFIQSVEDAARAGLI